MAIGKWVESGVKTVRVDAIHSLGYQNVWGKVWLQNEAHHDSLMTALPLGRLLMASM
jgi:hypothetical protein